MGAPQRLHIWPLFSLGVDDDFDKSYDDDDDDNGDDDDDGFDIGRRNVFTQLHA